MGAFENQCSEMSKEVLIQALGRALDARRELLAIAEDIAVGGCDEVCVPNRKCLGCRAHAAVAKARGEK